MSYRRRKKPLNNKKIIFHVTRQYMKRNKGRTAVTFTGIALMVMLMTCVFVGKDTVLRYLENVASMHAGSWHMTVHGLNNTNFKEVAAVDGIDKIGYVARQGFTDFSASASKDRPYLEIKAYSPICFELANIHVTQGRLPENEKEIIISETALTDGSSVRIGDVIQANYFDRSITGINPSLSESVFPYFGISVKYGETVDVPLNFPYYPENDDFRQNKEYRGTSGTCTVVGFMEPPDFESEGSAGYPALTVWNDVSGMDGTFSALLTLRLDGIHSADTVREAIESVTQDDVECNNMVLAFSANGSDSVISSVTVFIEVFFVVLIIAASLILIYNVFQMSFRERTKYLGMLSSVGATGRQKRFSVYYEAAVLLAAALPTGILLGMGVIKIGLLLLKPHLNKLIEIFQVGRFGNIPVRLSVNVNNLLLVAAFSIFTVMLSALIPAIKMGKIGPVESIRGNISGGRRRYPSQFRMLGKSGSGVCRLLAVNGTRRLPHLTRGIVRSIAVFGMLTAVTLYGAQSVIRVVNTKLRTNHYLFNLTGYDYVLISDSTHDDLYRSTVERIAKDNAVTQTKEIAEYSFRVDLNGSFLSEEYMQAYEEVVRAYLPSNEEYAQELLQNERKYNKWILMFCMEDEDFKKLAEDGDADASIANDPSRPAVLLYRKVELSTDNVRISGYDADYHFIEVQNAFRCAVGEEVPFVVQNSGGEENKSVSLTVAGFLDEAALAPFFSVHSEMPFVIVNRRAAALIGQAAATEKEQTVNSGYQYYLFGLKDGEGESLLKELSQKEEQADGVYYIVSYDAINGEKGFYGAIVSIIRILAYCFTAMISIVCLLNLWHSVKGRAGERRREIAMLRSMGMTSRQLRRMLTIENILMTGTGLLIAAALSSVFMLLLNRAITGWIGRMTLPVPYGLIGGIVVAACIVMALMTLVCYRYSGKESIVEDIRNETV